MMVLSAKPPMHWKNLPYPSLAGFLHQVVIVRNLGCGILLVILTLRVEEFLQDLSEGLDLILRHALLEVVGATELLVELLRTVQIKNLKRTLCWQRLFTISNLQKSIEQQQNPTKIKTTPGHTSQLLPRHILGLLQQQCLIFWAQSLLPCIEVILEATHGHLASSRSGGVHDEATLARQTAQHPGAQRQQHHRKEAHWTGHGVKWCFIKTGPLAWQS